MSSGGALQGQQVTLAAKVKTLINNDLREICRGENLQVSGVKSQLQSRILDREFPVSFPVLPVLPLPCLL
jgi:E3 SUMO-protein ligase PIAS1